MLFLIADVGVPLMSNDAVLDEVPSVARATAQLSPVQDVGILSTSDVMRLVLSGQLELS